MRYMTMCCCGCRLSTGVLVLGAIMSSQGLFDLQLELQTGPPVGPLSTFRLIWYATCIVAGIMGCIGALRARPLFVGRFSRFLLLSILVEVILTIIMLSTSLHICREEIERHEKAHDGGDTTASHLDEMEASCQTFLKTVSIIEVIFKVGIGLFFYCVATSYEHALLQFGTDAIMHASYPVPKQYLPQEAIAQPSGAGAGAAFSAALAAADSAAPRHATIVVREAEEMPVVQATCVA